MGSPVRPLGEVGVVVGVDDVATMLRLRAELAGAVPSHVEVVCGWSSVALIASGPDARAVLPSHGPRSQAALTRLLRAAVEAVDEADEADDLPAAARSTPLVIVDVVYDGPDLAAVADEVGLSQTEVVARHCGVDYAVALLGFARGFAYLAGLDPRLQVPRLPAPRVRVPAGAVGIAMQQTGIYPRESPGGWRLVARLAREHPADVLFDRHREPPGLLAVGDRVRFRQVRDVVRGGGVPARVRPSSSVPPSLQVLRPGLLTVVQDGGRPGRLAQGVSASGAADVAALRRGNRLVGNDEWAPTLEVIGALSLRVLRPVVVAVTGTDADVIVEAAPEGSRHCGGGRDVALDLPVGARLLVAAPRCGLRPYVALRGGVAADAVLGSPSWDSLAALGQPPLGTGDLICVGPTPPGTPWREQVPVAPLPRQVVVGVVEGWGAHWFATESWQALTQTTWEVSGGSDRTGLRLIGAPVPRLSGELPSEPVITGAVQVPANGQPIVLGPDAGTTGGYPVLAVVVRADLDLLAQVAPGTHVRFRRRAGPHGRGA